MSANLRNTPFGDPFRILPTRSTAKTRLGVNDGFHLTWEKKVLPDSVGAGNYAYETYGLPPFGVFGRGNIHVENPLRETFPASYVFQAVGIDALPARGVFQGQWITQPLMDPNAAAAMGIVLPGAIAGGPNQIGNFAPTLAP